MPADFDYTESEEFDCLACSRTDITVATNEKYDPYEKPYQ
jgi:hypothetical protein